MTKKYSVTGKASLDFHKGAIRAELEFLKSLLPGEKN
jgi:hypothetical protein